MRWSSGCSGWRRQDSRASSPETGRGNATSFVDWRSSAHHASVIVSSVGKILLPEVHYLGGHPLTEEVGRETRRMISRLAGADAPFFIVSFMATTHPPFTSKYPYYSMYARPDYRGESKFGMAKLRDCGEANFCVDADGRVYRIIDHRRVAFHCGRLR